MRVRVVAGHFDPVLAAHARRLAELACGGALIAVVSEPPRPLLPARARAELVAALGVVDYVLLAEDAERAGLWALLPADAVFQEQAEDERRTRELMEHVRRRHQSA